MGLDAVVYCDCFEKGRLREPPPTGCLLAVSGDGSLFCNSDDLDVQLAFDQWQSNRACEHEDGILVHHRIGNIALVAALRTQLEQEPHRFPFLLSKVLYSGTHCGDYISAQDATLLRPEIAALADVHCEEPDMQEFMRGFEAQMAELVEIALRVGKPISF